MMRPMQGSLSQLNLKHWQGAVASWGNTIQQRSLATLQHREQLVAPERDQHHDECQQEFEYVLG